MTVSSREHLPIITKKLLTINGDIDQYEDMMKRKAAEVIDLTEPVIDDGDQ